MGPATRANAQCRLRGAGIRDGRETREHGKFGEIADAGMQAWVELEKKGSRQASEACTKRCARRCLGGPSRRLIDCAEQGAPVVRDTSTPRSSRALAMLVLTPVEALLEAFL